MKCKTCNGLGRTKATEFIGVDEGLRDIVILCPTCGGKGEVEMTNEEWFIGLSTEEKAEFLAKKCCEISCKFFLGEAEEIFSKYWVEWLKQPHTTTKE
jgi:hypothetical protein